MGRRFPLGLAATLVVALGLAGSSPAQNPPGEHFLCYSAKSQGAFQAKTLTLQDKFGTRVAHVTQPAEFCNPVAKNSRAIVNKIDHERCYFTTGPDKNRKVTFTNQFGSFSGRVHQPIRLCLPSKKKLVGGPNPSPVAFQTNHYQCYRLQGTSVFPTRSVTLEDQFVTLNMTVKVPSVLCAPVRKNQTPIKYKFRFLVCYRRSSATLVVIRNLIVSNQFGKEALKTHSPDLLCLPSTASVSD